MNPPISTTTSRALETTFRDGLVPLLGPTISVRVFNQPVPDENAELLPAVIIAAHKKADYLALKVAGRTGEECEVEFDCRALDDVGVELLAKHLEDALVLIRPASGWFFLRFGDSEDERTQEGAVRSIKRRFTVYALTAP